MASAFRILGEGQLSLTKFLLVTDRLVDLQGLPCHARARAGAHQPGDRPLRVLEPVDGHARLHRARRSTRGRRACGSGSAIRCASCRASSAPVDAARRRAATCACSAAAASSSARRRFARRARAPRRASPAHPAFAGWPLVVVTDEPARATRSAMNFLWTTFTRFEPAADIHAAATRVVRHHVVVRPPDRDRCADEAVVPEGGQLPTRTWPRPCQPALDASTSPVAASRWATRSAGTSIRSGTTP